MIKSFLMSTAMGLMTMTLTLPAANLDAVGTSAAAVQCLFNPACTNTAQESLTPIYLPGTTSNGFLQTRVLLAETNAATAGYYGYEYRLDLGGIITASNHPACLTNVVRCSNTITLYTNRVFCHTNIVGVLKRVTCYTNILPATNVVACITNEIPGTNIVQCFTNAAGGAVCVTNVFPATNVVLCITNRIRARAIIACQTNIIDPGHPVVKCFTNRVPYHATVVSCRTNIVVCPGAPPCIKSFEIKFGNVASFDFNNDGTNDEAYVVTTGGAGTVHPASIQRVGKKLVVRFNPPLCAGESSVAVGLLSKRPPRDENGRICLTSGNLKVDSRAPGGKTMAQCDFDRLEHLLKDLRTRDFAGANDAERETHRTALLGYGHAAELAAQANNVDGVLAALAQIIVRADGGADDWVTSTAAHEVNGKLKSLLDCLEEASGRDLDTDEDEDENDRDDDDKN
jgi:hypothetical protein